MFSLSMFGGDAIVLASLKKPCQARNVLTADLTCFERDICPLCMYVHSIVHPLNPPLRTEIYGL